MHLKATMQLFNYEFVLYNLFLDTLQGLYLSFICTFWGAFLAYFVDKSWLYTNTQADNRKVKKKAYDKMLVSESPKNATEMVGSYSTYLELSSGIYNERRDCSNIRR